MYDFMISPLSVTQGSQCPILQWNLTLQICNKQWLSLCLCRGWWRGHRGEERFIFAAPVSVRLNYFILKLNHSFSTAGCASAKNACTRYIMFTIILWWSALDEWLHQMYYYDIKIPINLLNALSLLTGDDFSIIQQEIFMVKECMHHNIVAYFGSYLW